MYNCEILADSLSPQGHRLTTFKVTYPRIVHAELMTHRVFSRNAASSRGIPAKKMIEYVKNNMFTPLAIQKTHKGMQGSNYFKGVELEQANQLWIESAELALQQAEKMEKFGFTKQLTNRTLEPYQYYQVLVTATEWENFFELRAPSYVIEGINGNKPFKSKKEVLNKLANSNVALYNTLNNYTDLDWLQINTSQADIHIQAIAEMMWDEFNSSTPKQLKPGEWHIPDLGHEWDLVQMSKLPVILNPEDTSVNLLKVRIATAHCAKISYDNFGTKVNYEADIKLHDRLLESKHFSPFEHCAKAMSDEEYYLDDRGVGLSDKLAGWCRNFRGFIQYRDLIDN